MPFRNMPNPENFYWLSKLQKFWTTSNFYSKAIARILQRKAWENCRNWAAERSGAYMQRKRQTGIDQAPFSNGIRIIKAMRGGAGKTFDRGLTHLRK